MGAACVVAPDGATGGQVGAGVERAVAPVGGTGGRVGGGSRGEGGS